MKEKKKINKININNFLIIKNNIFNLNSLYISIGLLFLYFSFSYIVNNYLFIKTILKNNNNKYFINKIII